MRQNVGTLDQMVRFGIGAAAGAAALRAHGWEQAALCSVATAAFFTAMTRRCPLNAALGVNTSAPAFEPGRIDRHDQGVRDTEIRRQTQTSAAMGQLPGSIRDR